MIAMPEHLQELNALYTSKMNIPVLKFQVCNTYYQAALPETHINFQQNLQQVMKYANK